MSCLQEPQFWDRCPLSGEGDEVADAGTCGTCAHGEVPDPAEFGETGIVWCRLAGEFARFGDAPCDEYE